MRQQPSLNYSVGSLPLRVDLTHDNVLYHK